MRNAHRWLVYGALLLRGAVPLLGQTPPEPTAAEGHGGARPEIEEPILADLLARLRAASPLLAAARARREEALDRHRRCGGGSEPAATDPRYLERQAEVAVGTLFARIYEIDRELEVHAAGADLLGLLKEAATSRYVAGEAGQEELVRAQLEALHASERRIELEGRRAELVVELNRQVGFPATTPLGPISRLPAQLPPPPGASFEASANAPLLVVARERLRQAQKEERASGATEKAGKAPEKVSGDSRSSARATEIAAARAELQGAEGEVQAEVERLRAAWEREDRLLTHSRDGLLPQSGLLFEAIRTSYLAGRVPFSAVVEALRMWLEARIGIARHESARFVAGAGLEALLFPVSPSPSPTLQPSPEPEP